MTGLSPEEVLIELLEFLMNKPKREVGTQINAIPKHLLDDLTMLRCAKEGWIEIFRRNHIWSGPESRRKLIVEDGWQVGNFSNSIGRKPFYLFLREAIDESIPDEIRYRVRITDDGAMTLRTRLQSPRSLTEQEATEPGDKVGTPKSRKRRTKRGTAAQVILAALVKHHEYDNGGCRVGDPITVTELSELAGVSKSIVSDYFKEEFGGYPGYKQRCLDLASITWKLKWLTREFTEKEMREFFKGNSRQNEHDDD